MSVKFINYIISIVFILLIKHWILVLDEYHIYNHLYNPNINYINISNMVAILQG